MKTAERRERPADGGVEWHGHLNAFECRACAEFIPMRRKVWNDPEKLAEMREMLVLDHAECWLYNDAEKARQARKYRKEKKRRYALAWKVLGAD
jgi:hypothetical protein